MQSRLGVIFCKHKTSVDLGRAVTLPANTKHLYNMSITSAQRPSNGTGFAEKRVRNDISGGIK